MRAGFHSVFLETYGIHAELTATERVGFHRYSFPDTETCSIVFDLGAELGPSRMSDALLRVVGSDELELDFMHFQADGHKILADKLNRLINEKLLHKPSPQHPNN